MAVVFPYHKGPSINYVVSVGRGGGSNISILLSKKGNKEWGGGQKSPILRQHSLWTAPYVLFDIMPEEASKGFLEKSVIKFRTMGKQPVCSL